LRHPHAKTKKRAATQKVTARHVVGGGVLDAPLLPLPHLILNASHMPVYRPLAAVQLGCDLGIAPPVPPHIQHFPLIVRQAEYKLVILRPVHAKIKLHTAPQ
jgi:hypothetical protein